MTTLSGPAARLDRVLDRLPLAYAGPGGAVAVLKDGEILVRHAWGYANAERRTPFTPRTLFRICSITKQFTCALTLGAFPDPQVLDVDISERLPHLAAPAPGAMHLCHNQSGLRDYWALAMLQGAGAESDFGEDDASRVMAGTRSLQFMPGTRYSYANQNFRLLSDIVSRRLGESFADLLRRRLFDPAGMETALLAADTRALPDGAEGYEGDVASGFRPAKNNLIWTGDAGIAACLDDMIAWERLADAGRDDATSVYGRLAAETTFADGAPAAYGFGLARGRKFDRSFTGHGGALRGWRSHRLYCAAERVSVVVLFNHLADPAAAALELFAAAIGARAPKPTAAPAVSPDLIGNWLEPETGLLVRVAQDSEGKVGVRFGHGVEVLATRPDGSAADQDTRLEWRNGGAWMYRGKENQTSRLIALATEASPIKGCAGQYRCDELDAELTIADAGGALFGGCSGALGQGRMELLDPAGADVWTLPCPRALDHTPPGDWTLHLQRDESGAVGSVRVGCWLARGLLYVRHPDRRVG